MDTELKRVSERIGGAILAFASQCSKPFHVDELRRFVLLSVPDIAPDSPGRILRDLRKKRALNYRVLSRRDSLYEFVQTA